MCIAIIGSRTLSIPDLGIYLPKDTTEIISGGAKGVDTSAREYALAHHLPLTELRPDYRRYRKGAPLKRTIEIFALCGLIFRRCFSGLRTEPMFPVDGQQRS